jgi:hypothetical protein
MGEVSQGTNSTKVLVALFRIVGEPISGYGARLPKANHRISNQRFKGREVVSSVDDLGLLFASTPDYRRTSPGIRMRELPVVECPHIIVVIPAFGRCRCGVDRP